MADIKLIYRDSPQLIVEGGPFVLIFIDEEGTQAALATSFNSREEAEAFKEANREAIKKCGKWIKFAIVDMRFEQGIRNFPTREEAEAASHTKQ